MANDTKTQPETTTEDNYTGEGVQAPEVNKKGKPTRSAFKDGDQAYSVFRNLENDNRLRTQLNAEIVARHTGKPPHEPQELTNANQNWRSNFPTLALMGIEGRITAKLVATVDNLRSLTNSVLPEAFENHDEKSKKYQARTTSWIRRWRGWRPFIAALCTENVLIGYALAALLDTFNWRPRLFRSDEAFLPQGCAQFPEFVQMSGLKQSFLIHEAVEWIKNGKEVADVAGFEFDNVMRSVNRAMPKAPLQEHGSASIELSRVYQDLIREGNVGMAYSTGAKGIDVAHVIGIEPDTQKVSHYMVDRKDEHATLFFEEGQFESMNDALCMFTLEPGNSTYYGSKGLGRKCVNITTAMDVTANDAVDAYRLSAYGVLKTDSKGGMSTQFKIVNPFVMVATDGEIQAQGFQFNANSFERLYGKLGQILENAVGEYIPNLPDPINPEEKNRTATGERIDYQREQEQSIAFIARFLGQFFEMIGPMQKRMGDPDTTDEEAQQYQKELKEIDGLDQEEIDLLRKQATAEVVQDLAAQRNQQITAIAQLYTGNPNVDQKKLLEYNISALSSPQIADELVIPEAIDPTEAAEQVRQQAMENIAIQSGGNINISPRDNDEEHLKVLVGEIDQDAPKLLQKQVDDPDLPQLLDNLNAALIHGEAHLNSWKTKQPNNPDIPQYEQKFKQYDQSLTKLGTIISKSRQMQQSQQEAQPQQSQQTPMVGQPPQQQAQPPQPAQHSDEPQVGGMPEKVLIAWISQFPIMSEEAKRRLEIKSGLGADQAAPQPGEVQNATVVPTS